MPTSKQDPSVQAAMNALGGGVTPSGEPAWKKVLDFLTTPPKPVRKWEQSPVGRTLIQWSKVPSEGELAVIGAGQRAVAANIPYTKEHPGAAAAFALGPLGLIHPGAREMAGRAISAAVHPNDPNIEANAEHAVGIDKLISKMPDNLLGRIGAGAVRTGFETVTDPASYVVPEMFGNRLLEGYDRLANAAVHSEVPALSKAARFMTANSKERVANWSRDSRDAINTARQQGQIASRARAIKHEAILAKHKDRLQEIERNNEFEKAAQYKGRGTRHVLPRELERALGTRGPQDLTLFKLPEPTIGGELAGKWGPKKPMDLPQNTPPWKLKFQEMVPKKPPSLEEKIRVELAEQRRVLAQKVTERSLHKYLKGVPLDELQKIAQTEFGGRGQTLSQNLSRAQIEALFATGFPHVRNVSVMGFLSMGEVGLARAAYYVARGIPTRLKRQLGMGGSTKFFAGPPESYIMKVMTKVPPIRWMRDFSTKFLDRADEALRAARLEELNIKSPRMPLYKKLARVNDDIGQYYAKPEWVNFVTDHLAANFAQWHGYVVPTAVTRAALKYPGRVNRFSRYQQNLNDALWPDSPGYVSFGGPVDEMTSFMADPVRLLLEHRPPSYTGSSSTAGPFIGAAVDSILSKDLRQSVTSQGLGFLPLGGAIDQALNNPFKSKWSAGQRAAGDTFGLYTQNRTPLMRNRAQSLQRPGYPVPGDAPPPSSKSKGDVQDALKALSGSP